MVLGADFEGRAKQARTEILLSRELERFALLLLLLVSFQFL